MKKKSGGKLESEAFDPIKDAEIAKAIGQNYGFRPQRMSLFSTEKFYFYLTLQYDNKIYSLRSARGFQCCELQKGYGCNLKATGSRFLANCGHCFTTCCAGESDDGAIWRWSKSWATVSAAKRKLSENYAITNVALDKGQVPGEVDVLVVLAPKDLNEKQIFAIDQFLMKGGTLVLATSGVSVSQQGQKHVSQSHNSGLNDWLAHHGIEIPRELVLDTQNSGFPLLRKRNIGGITLTERYIAPNYPFFIDVRSKGINQENPITSGLQDINMTWASPAIVSQEKNKNAESHQSVKEF